MYTQSPGNTSLYTSFNPITVRNTIEGAPGQLALFAVFGYWVKQTYEWWTGSPSAEPKKTGKNIILPNPSFASEALAEQQMKRKSLAAKATSSTFTGSCTPVAPHLDPYHDRALVALPQQKAFTPSPTEHGTFTGSCTPTPPRLNPYHDRALIVIPQNNNKGTDTPSSTDESIRAHFSATLTATVTKIGLPTPTPYETMCSTPLFAHMNNPGTLLGPTTLALGGCR